MGGGEDNVKDYSGEVLWTSLPSPLPFPPRKQKEEEALASDETNVGEKRRGEGGKFHNNFNQKWAIANPVVREIKRNGA